MSEELYEIAFSGQLVEGADLETVKQHIGRIFKADEQRLAQMFSGRRVLIKRQADAATMAKYRGAFEKAGAICEIRPLSAPEPDPVAAAVPAAASPASAAAEALPGSYQSRYPESEVVPQALLTEPLGVSADQIDELQTDLAPVGSPLQYEIKEPVAPQFDFSELAIAPVGSSLSDGKEEPHPPLPDTSGLSVEELES